MKRSSVGVLFSVLAVFGLMSASPVGALTGPDEAESAADVRVSPAVASVIGAFSEASVAAEGSGLFNGVSPARLVDTRPGRSTVDGMDAGGGPLSGERSFIVTGRGGVPRSDVGAVVLNVTVTAPVLNGYATVYPTGGSQPIASNINFLSGGTVPNAVIAKIGAGGMVTVFTSTTADLIVDISGWLPSSSNYSGLVPARLADSRSGRPTFDGLQSGFGAFKDVHSVQVAGRGGVPPVGAGAVVLNVTLANGVTDGYTTVFPTGETRPNASSVNYTQGGTVANLVIAKVGAGGKVDLFNLSKADVIVDVAGWLPTGSDYTALVPARLVDSRPGRDTIDGAERRFGAFEGVRDFKVTDRAGIPVDAGVVVLNVTVTGSETNGFSTVFPAGESAPNASNLNYLQGHTAANLVIATVGAGGKVSVLNSTKAHVIIDVAGWIPSPTELGEPIQFKQISTGGTETGSGHTCGVTLAGAAKCWGSNVIGQLGDGTIRSSSTPVSVRGLSSGVKSIAVGLFHTCAVTISGEAKCWGYNGGGQLGDGTAIPSITPVTVSGVGSDFASISAGSDHTCALTATGAAKCWGGNAYGQLGDGSTTNRKTPVDVSGLGSGVGSLSAGWDHTCAVTSAGAVQCWGSGAALDAGPAEDVLTPISVEGLGSGVSSVSAGYFHTCAVTTDGAAKCWGYNSAGQLGDGTTADNYTPVDVVGMQSGVATVSAGITHTCAVTSAGSAKCWGSNIDGQLGDGSLTNASTPVQVSGLGSDAASVSAGAFHTCGLMASGAAKCWGSNSDGQLGDGTTTAQLTPVDVESGGPDVVVPPAGTCSTIVTDYRYDGPENTLNNVTMWSSEDGTCSGSLLAKVTVVYVSSEQYVDAELACKALDPAFDSAYGLPSEGFPGGAFVCSY